MKILFFFLQILIASLSSSLQAEVSVEVELDPYYTNVGIFVPLVENNMDEIVLANEMGIYLKLLKNAVTPLFLLVEASVNPLPVLGTYLRDKHQDVYDRGEINSDLNIIQALTEGFEEPYAISLFLGNIIRFRLPDEKETEAINKGFSGFLVSFGDQHIKENVLIDDNWYEVEWKLKGDQRLRDIYHSWSFRIGGKTHSNSGISDTLYVGIRRELFNYAPGNHPFINNLGIDYRLSFSRDTRNIVQHNFFVEKNWPGETSSFSLGLGLSKTIDKYLDDLSDPEDEIRLIIRPGFSF
ncbi:MAG: hypothetical protein ACI845_002369 [Gammaproteobacteria bacterium]|jgi:hypothetical protein